jgi:hypothetical protein
MGTSNEAKIWAVLGSSGCGKGLWIKQEIRRLKPSRLIILDTKDENGEFAEPVATLRDLARATFAKQFKVRYVPRGRTKKDRQAEFEEICRMVSHAKDCVYLIEELGRYTTPSYAPPAWADCCNDGRHDGLHIIAASQFPAQIDKAFLGNATVIHSGYLGEQTHRKVVAEKMDIEAEQLKGLQNLEFLHFDRATRTVSKGVVKNPYR